MNYTKTLLYSSILNLLVFTSCMEKGITGEWKCYDFIIADTTGIPSVLIEEAKKSAVNTVMIFNEDSTYQQDYIVEETELISEIGHYSIREDNIALNPEKIGVKELSSQEEIEYKSIANSDFLTAIAQHKKYRFKIEGEQLSLIDFIYGGLSRNKTNETTLKFQRR